MSYASHSLPPGDRDERPSTADPIAGRADRVVPTGAEILFDGAARALDELTASFAAANLAHNHAALPAVEAIAHKHAALALAFARAVTAARVRAATKEA